MMCSKHNIPLEYSHDDNDAEVWSCPRCDRERSGGIEIRNFTLISQDDQAVRLYSDSELKAAKLEVLERAEIFLIEKAMANGKTTLDNFREFKRQIESE